MSGRFGLSRSVSVYVDARLEDELVAGSVRLFRPLIVSSLLPIISSVALAIKSPNSAFDAGADRGEGIPFPGLRPAVEGE